MTDFTKVRECQGECVGFRTKNYPWLFQFGRKLKALTLTWCLMAAVAAAQNSPPNPAPAPGGPQNIFYGAVPPDSAQGPVIVFVHGLKGIAADWWLNAVDGTTNPMYAMAYAAGYRTAFVCLDPNCQRNATETWLQNTTILQQQLVAIAKYYGINNSGVVGPNYDIARNQLYIVAHSMGGLTAEAALLNTTLTALEPTVAPLVKAVFTLSTPNHGTPLADWAFGPGAALATLFGMHTPAVQSMEVGVVTAFRTTADPILAPSGIQFYTFAGNTFIAPQDPVIEATGLILHSLAPGSNDGLVPLSSVPLPDGYSFDLGQTKTNHFGMIEGNESFPVINPVIENLQREIPGFSRIATAGFGDENNNYPWSMKWFNGKLYVGTGRLVGCVTALASDVQRGTKLYGSTNCSSDPYTLPLAAEIWQYTPATKTWLRVYQSPQDVPITDASGNPIMTARDIGYRGMEIFTEADGTQALYVAGVTSGEIYGNLAGWTLSTYPPPRILRSTDGVNWAPLPQGPGTFLGDLTLNYTNAFGIRSLTSYNGMLFATAGTYTGDGMVIASANPSAGGNAWFQAAPVDSQFPVWDMKVFNNLLYAIGGSRALGGYFVTYTNAQGMPPYNWTYVVSNGANTTPGTGPDAALSAEVFNNQLYVGTDGPAPVSGQLSGGTELIRIHPDNTTWELVVGTPFTSPLGNMSPVSGIGQYFDNEFNRHFWRMAVYPAGRHQGLYLGTYDYSITFSSFWQLSNLVTPQYGADLMMSPDGTNWKLVTDIGFGDGQNEGFRSIENTPFGLFVGAARLNGGTQIWLDQSVLDFNNDGIIDQNDVSIIQAAVGQIATANDPRDLDQDGQITANDVQLESTQCTYPSCASAPTPAPSKPPAPVLASVAPASSGSVSLSWSPVAGAAEYRVYRQTATPLLDIFPPGGITVTLGPLPIKIPQDVLNGDLNTICPPGAESSAPPPCTYIYLVEEAAQPGNQIGFPVSLDYLGATSGTSFQDIPAYSLQSLYYVRAEDAAGNLSDPSNVIGGPAFTSSGGGSTSSLAESPNALTFSAIAGSSAAVLPQNLEISTEGGATPLQFTVSTTVISPTGGTWLQVAQTTGTAPIAPGNFLLGVTVNTAGLQPGVYLASIVVTGQDGSSHPVTVTLDLTSSSGSGGPDALIVDTSSLSFAYTINGTLPANQTINVSSASASAEFLLLAVFNQQTANSWLLFSPGSGNTVVYPSTTPITVSVVTTGLATGTYTANLLVADSNGNVQTINVTLNVSPAPPSPGGGSDLITVSALSLSFAFTTGGTQPGAQTLQVSTATGSATVPFTVKAVGSNQWLGVSPVSGSTPTSLAVTANPRNLPPGTYTETLVFNPAGTKINQVVPVTLTISAPGPPPPAEIANQLIPHLTNGAGWSFTILLVNNSTSPQQFTVRFFGDAGGILDSAFG